MHDPGAGARYQTSLDRIGLALAIGGLLGGVVSAILVAMGGRPDPLAIAAALVLGSLLCTLGIAATAAPLWLILHASGRRGPAYAATLGAIIGIALFVAAGGGAIAGWSRQAGMAMMLAALAAAIALAMWRVAYRAID